MEEKLRFIFEYERDEQSKSELCASFGISRETGYVWLRRYRELGKLGLVELNRAARRHPNQTPWEIEEQVLELRQAHMRWGPRKLKRVLERDEPGRCWPTVSTITDWPSRFTNTSVQIHFSLLFSPFVALLSVWLPWTKATFSNTFTSMRPNSKDCTFAKPDFLWRLFLQPRIAYQRSTVMETRYSWRRRPSSSLRDGGQALTNARSLGSERADGSLRFDMNQSPHANLGMGFGRSP